MTRPGRRSLSPEVQITTGPSKDATPLHTRIYRRLREHILERGFAAGARLPSARTLASDLKVSRNTVETAFAQLVAEGFVVRKVGAGTVVADSLVELAPFSSPRHRGASTAEGHRAASKARLSRRGTAIARRSGGPEPEFVAPDVTDIDAFPVGTWNRLMARQVRRGAAVMMSSCSPHGLRELRAQIAEYASLARGVRCHADQVVVVSGTQQALDLSARVLLDPGDEAIIEHPGYVSGRNALASAGARLRPIAIDEEGLRADRLPESKGRRLVYLTPSHQFPTGVILSLPRRLAILGWAARTGAWILEDDYDSEFRYDGRPLAALQALDTNERVIYIGTFNKVLFPGLRLGYLIVPEGLIDAFIAARRVTDGFSSSLSQMTLADFMASGHFSAFLRQARQRYGEKRRRLVEGVAREWSGSVRLGPSSTGLHVVAHLPDAVDDVRLARDTQHTRLGVTPLSPYYAGTEVRRGLILSYGATPVGEITSSIERMAPLIDAAIRAGVAPRTRASLTS